MEIDFFEQSLLYIKWYKEDWFYWAAIIYQIIGIADNVDMIDIWSLFKILC